MKYQYQGLLLVAVTIGLTGCMGESLCEDYKAIPVRDVDGNGEEDYRVQVIGDSILAYHGINCKSVGHRLGFEINEPVLISPVTGAQIREIKTQYQAPPEHGPDYDYVVLDGGLNDLIANSNPGSPDATPCDCNGLLDHEACIEEVEDIRDNMEDIISTIQSTSSATIALLSYYPPSEENSFIGACFPYVDQLNERYRDIADQDDSVAFIETYGFGVPVIQTVSPLGEDNYHPDPEGSAQISFFIQQQLDL